MMATGRSVGIRRHLRLRTNTFPHRQSEQNDFDTATAIWLILKAFAAPIRVPVMVIGAESVAGDQRGI